MSTEKPAPELPDAFGDDDFRDDEPRRPRRRRNPLIALAGIALTLGVFGWMLWGGIDDNMVYFLSPTELAAKGTAAHDLPVRLGGMVEQGSVIWDAERLDLRFKVTDGTTVIAVHSTGAPPQMFQNEQGVILEGRYGKDGVFESDKLMVKHSNEYHPPKTGERPTVTYRELPQKPAD